MENNTQKTKPNPKKNRRIVRITAGFLVLFGLYLLVFLVPDVLRTASGPQSMTLQQAAEVATDQSLYVSLEDGLWDCQTIKHITRRSPNTSTGSRTTTDTEIFISDDRTRPNVAIFARMSGRMTCGDFDGLIATGYLTQMGDDERQTLTNQARLAKFFNADSVLSLCGYCGTENSLIGLIFGIVITLAGIGLFILGYKMPSE